MACEEACIGREEVYVWPTACIERPTQAGIAGRGGEALHQHLIVPSVVGLYGSPSAKDSEMGTADTYIYEYDII